MTCQYSIFPLFQDQSRPYDSKKNVWVPDPEEGYIEGEIKGPGPKADTVIVTAGGKDVTLKKDLVQEMNPPKFEKTEDMSNLTFLNDASVLANLRSRYAAMLIYVSFLFFFHFLGNSFFRGEGDLSVA